MKRLLSLCSVALLLCLASCIDRRDDNGNLYGMWQLTAWTNAEGDTVRSKGEMYYYFDHSLMKLHLINQCYHLARFSHEPDTLRVTAAYAEPNDAPTDISELSIYGVPEDGIFVVEALTEDILILRSRYAYLAFRRY